MEQNIISHINNGLNVICHCRGGIGRAGLIGSCILLKKKIVLKTD